MCVFNGGLVFEIGSLPKGGGCVVKGSFLVCLEFFKTHSFYISVFLGGPPSSKKKPRFRWKTEIFSEKPLLRPPVYRTNRQAVVGCGMWDLWNRIPQPPLAEKLGGGCGMWDVGSLGENPTTNLGVKSGGGCGMWDVGSLEENPTTTLGVKIRRWLWDVGCGISGIESHNHPWLKN